MIALRLRYIDVACIYTLLDGEGAKRPQCILDPKRQNRQGWVLAVDMESHFIFEGGFLVAPVDHGEPISAARISAYGG